MHVMCSCSLYHLAFYLSSVTKIITIFFSVCTTKDPLFSDTIVNVYTLMSAIIMVGHHVVIGEVFTIRGMTILIINGTVK